MPSCNNKQIQSQDNIKINERDVYKRQVSNRIGLANSDDVLKTEQSLMKKIPKEYWSNAHHWIISVSYTHLDVYKRQTIGTSSAGISTPRSPLATIIPSLASMISSILSTPCLLYTSNQKRGI